MLFIDVSFEKGVLAQKALVISLDILKLQGEHIPCVCYFLFGPENQLRHLFPQPPGRQFFDFAQ